MLNAETFVTTAEQQVGGLNKSPKDLWDSLIEEWQELRASTMAFRDVVVNGLKEGVQLGLGADMLGWKPSLV